MALLFGLERVPSRHVSRMWAFLPWDGSPMASGPELAFASLVDADFWRAPPHMDHSSQRQNLPVGMFSGVQQLNMEARRTIHLVNQCPGVISCDHPVMEHRAVLGARWRLSAGWFPEQAFWEWAFSKDCLRYWNVWSHRARPMLDC